MKTDYIVEFIANILPELLLLLIFLFFMLIAVLDIVFYKLCRRRKVKRRIIRQAKAAGVWDNLNALGGRALELKAWEAYRIKRKSGETDAALRIRCKNVADRAADKLEMAPKLGGRENGRS